MIQPGVEVEKYVVDAVLGQGGMAVVYRVHHRTLGGLHALKVLTIASEPLQQRLLQEGRAQARLQHPNVVEVRDVLDVRGFPGLLMEYVPDGSLADRLERGGLSMVEIETIFRGIVSGMRRAHALGFIHRDLKPANVLLARQEDRWLPKITDFGLVKCVEDSAPQSTRSNVAMGTPGYMSPEQVRDSRGVDMRTDIFALGALLYEMVTGRPPFVGADLSVTLTATMNGAYQPVRELAPDVPDELEAVIAGCLRTDRRDRLPDCEAILGLLGDPGEVSGHRPGRVLTNGESGAPGLRATPDPSPATFAPDVSLAPRPSPVPPTRRARKEGARGAKREARRGSGLAWAAGGLVSVVLIGFLFALGALGVWSATMGGGSDAPVAASPAATGVAAPVPAEDVARPEPVTTPPPKVQAQSGSGRSTLSPSRGAGGGTPAADPEAAAAPTTAPSPAVAEPPEVAMGSVRVEGDAQHVWLVDGMRRLAPGDVAPGRYALEAGFDSKGAVPAGSVTVAAGQTVTVVCTAALFRCGVR